jgi:hypothetical protein
MNQELTIDNSAAVVPVVFMAQPSLLDAVANERLVAFENELIEQVGPSVIERRPPLGPGGSISGCSWAGGGGWDDCDE